MDMYALMRWFSIRMRMVGAIGVVLGLLGLLGGAGMLGMFRIHAMSEDFMANSFAEVSHMAELRGEMGAIRQHEKDMIIAYEKPESVKAAHTKWLASLEQAKKVAGRFMEGTQGEDSAIARAFVGHLDRYGTQFAPVAQLLLSGGYESAAVAHRMSTEAAAEFTATGQRLEELDTHLRQEVQRTVQRQRDTSNQTKWLFVLAVCITVLVVAPWNYPYLTAVNAIIPALMAGNAVLLKHASQTLLVGERFAQAFARAGLPDGLFHNLVLDHGQTGALIASGQVQQVNFTGSVEGGRMMESAAAGHFIGVGLELGGKDPAYVRADADLAHAVENLVDGSFFNSGQSCCGIERIYVDHKLYPAFVEGFVELTRQYVLGNPLDQATTLGPLVRAQAAEFVRGQIAQATAKGARALIDASSFAADAPGTPYLAPQVLVQVDHEMAVMREESFGPVVGIMPVASDAEAIALMNDSPYGLSAAIWTSDLDAAERLGGQLETGTVFMNRCDYLDPALAWTGVKHTGRGATLSRLGYEHLTRPKSFHLRHAL